MKEVKLSTGEIINIAPLTVRVLRNADKKDGDMDKMVYIVSALSNKTEEEIDDLDVKDFISLQKVVEGFLKEAGVVA